MNRLPINFIKRILKKFEMFFFKKGYYPVQIIDNIPLIFIHINKNGGTSMSEAIGMKRKIHRSAIKIKEIVSQNEWNDSIKFTIIRNPFSRVVSQYNFSKKTGLINKNLKFKEWVIKTYGLQRPSKRFFRNNYIFKTQLDWITIENVIITDYILRFENLEKDILSMNKKFGTSIRLKHLNSTKKVDYKTYYDSESKEIISNFFNKDLTYFNYEF